MAANSVPTPHTAVLDRQKVYVYGIRGWWMRLALLAVYAVAVLLLLAVALSWQLYFADKTEDTLYSLLRCILLFGMWQIALVTVWRWGNTKVSRIDYLAKRDVIEFHTINFSIRAVGLSSIQRVERQMNLFNSKRQHQNITISFRSAPPLEVDTACAWIDQTLFDQIFPSHTSTSGLPPRTNGMHL